MNSESQTFNEHKDLFEYNVTHAIFENNFPSKKVPSGDKCFLVYIILPTGCY